MLSGHLLRARLSAVAHQVPQHQQLRDHQDSGERHLDYHQSHLTRKTCLHRGRGTSRFHVHGDLYCDPCLFIN